MTVNVERFKEKLVRANIKIERKIYIMNTCINALRKRGRVREMDTDRVPV